MSKTGYFVDEDTIERMKNTLLALRCFNVLAHDARDTIPLDELSAMLNVISHYSDNSIQQAEYGHWQKQEAKHVQKSV